MKKTLYTSVLALCCACAAVAEDLTDPTELYTFTTGACQTSSSGNGSYTSINNFSIDADSYGLSLAVDTWATSCSDSSISADEAGFTTGTTVSLDSIVLYSRTDSQITDATAKYYIDPATIMIITSNVDGSVITSDALTISDEMVTIGSTSVSAYAMTFSFDAADSIVLDDTYTITFGTVDEDGDITSLDLGMNVATAAGGTDSGWYVNTDTNYGPNGAVATTSTYTIPEPATATLSLVALAGLMVRRRRQA